MSGIGFDRMMDIVGLVDVQPTFMPGGELPWRRARRWYR